MTWKNLGWAGVMGIMASELAPVFAAVGIAAAEKASYFGKYGQMGLFGVSALALVGSKVALHDAEILAVTLSSLAAYTIVALASAYVPEALFSERFTSLQIGMAAVAALQFAVVTAIVYRELEKGRE